MERYKEISVADVFELILKGEISNVYYQNGNKELSKASETSWYFKTIAKYKFFKREVIEWKKTEQNPYFLLKTALVFWGHKGRRYMGLQREICKFL